MDPSDTCTKDYGLGVSPTEHGYHRRTSSHISRKTSWGTPIIPPRQKDNESLKEGSFEDIDLEVTAPESKNSYKKWNTLDNIAALGLSLNEDESDVPKKKVIERFSLDDTDRGVNLSVPLENYRPFQKWMKTIQGRGHERRKTVDGDMRISALEQEFLESPGTRRRAQHKQSLSGSSFGFVTAVKSASISLASFSIAPRSRRTGISSRHQRTDRSSKGSVVGRLSEDSSYIARSIVIDQDVRNRLLQRRRVLEEIIKTEESYLGDIKFLMNVYVTLLATIPSLSLKLRASINQNLNDIVELHEELLGELHRTVPNSEYTQLETLEPPAASFSKGHHRWRSLDALPEYTKSSTWLQKIPGMTAEPRVAAEVAKVFGRKLNRFFLYEEYGAKYELMIRDVASVYRTIPQWEVYQKGLEALASSLSSLNSQQDRSKKALTIGDLLVKPIQRVCKYPLLFSELLKHTPVCDCPDSHIEIENVLTRLRETTMGINRATDDPRMRLATERTWLLQDRLVFANMTDSLSGSSIRALGHIHLCGVLHVSWQTRDGVSGQYQICLLYRDFLLLASAAKNDQVYTIQACIRLSDLEVENMDNGRGLQSHTAAFSWKVVFECDHQLFEMIMSACSHKEEVEWRSRLADHSNRTAFGGVEQIVFTSLSIEIKPIGSVFGKPGTIARRLSIQRATTVGPMSGLCQVIIRNTNAFKEPASTASINRSQSLFMTNRVPILAPLRAERIRLEALLADVWTREVLPFPAMTGRPRSENLTRTSTSSIMRKLSIASITSNFTKRSGSLASLKITTEDDEVSRSETPRAVIGPAKKASEASRSSLTEAVESTISSLSLVPENDISLRSGSAENLSVFGSGNAGSAASTLQRFVTMKGKGARAQENQATITPPPRSSSANSANKKVTPASTAIIDVQNEEKENMPQAKTSNRTSPPIEKQMKKSRGIGMNRAVVAEGIRNFFR